MKTADISGTYGFHWNAQTVGAWSQLTAAGAVVLAALLRVTLEAAVEAVLPELGEPGVPGVVLRSQLQVVVVEPLDVGRLELDGDAAGRLPHVAVRHVVAVGPAVTEELQKPQSQLTSHFGKLCFLAHDFHFL